MPYPKEFYYTETTSKLRYSSKPSGKIDVKRAIEGNPDCFISANPASEQKQKKLILADWTALTWDEEKLVLAKDRLKELMNEGYLIYLWESEAVRPLTRENINKLDDYLVREQITPVSREQICKTAVMQQKLTRDSVFILDNYWMEHLLYPETSKGEYCLKISQITPLEGNASLLPEILKEASPQVSSLICNEWSSKAKLVQEFICESVPFDKVEEQIDTIKLKSSIPEDEIKKLISVVAKSEKLQTFEAQEIQIQNEIKDLLVALPPVEILNLENCDNISDALLLMRKESLAQIKKLSLARSDINTETLVQLLPSMHNLKKLDLNGCKNVENVINFLEEESLSRLKIINLDNSNVKEEDIKKLLLNGSLLEMVSLKNCPLTEEILLSLKKDSLNKLKRLRTDKKFSMETLNNLLLAAPNLEELSLYPYTDEELLPLLSIPEGSLSKLKSLILPRGGIGEEILEKLIIAAPQQEKLNLSFSEIRDFSFLKDKSLLQLKNLQLPCSEITPHGLEKILAAAPNLEYITIQGSDNLFSSGVLKDEVRALLLARPNLECPELKKELKKEAGLGKQTSNKNEFSKKLSDFSNSSNQAQSNPVTIKRHSKTDADTSDPNAHYNIKRIFYPLDQSEVHVSHYRLEVYNHVDVNPEICTANEAFETRTVGDPQFKSCNAERKKEDVYLAAKALEKKWGSRYVYGKKEFVLDTEWQAIPSLSPDEELLQYHTSPEAEVELIYSERDNLYYIRSCSGKKNLSLDFLLQVPTQEKSIPEQLWPMVEYYQEFGPGILEMDTDNPTGADYLCCIQKQKKGACRHRSLAFFAQMQKEFPEIPVRIVRNPSHSFVEIHTDEGWVFCDLKGYPATYEIEETNKPRALPERLMQPWLEKQSERKDLPVYLQTLVQPAEERNRLVNLDSEASVTAMVGSLQKHCQDIHRPFFYIHSPEDVVCAAAYIEAQEGNKGVLKKGPGGPLHDFLTADYEIDNPPILLINYSRFNADDVVRLNNLVDKNRDADETKIPESALVIGLVDSSKPGRYNGSDFNSRFDRKETNPVSPQQLKQQLALFPARVSLNEQEPNVINLYHSPHWKAMLLGSYRLEGENLIFSEGLLPAALKKGKHLTIQNGPWDDPEFVFFWQLACLSGVVRSSQNGIEFNTQGLSLDTQEGYDWDLLKKTFAVDESKPKVKHHLNPSNLSDFFSRYEPSVNKTLISLPGYIEEAANNEAVLEVYLTRNLGEDGFAMLLAECQKHGVALKLSAAPGVNLPKVLQDMVKVEEKPSLKSWNGSLSSTSLIISTDLDATVEHITGKKEKGDWLVLDVSECNAADLLVHIKPEFKEEPKPHLEFTRSERVLLKALEEGRSVILKGRFSAGLADELASLVLSRQEQTQVKGQLILVSEQEEPFSYCKTLSVHEVTVEEKQALVGEQSSSVVDWSKPLTRIRAELQFPQGFNGLRTIENGIKPLAPFNPETSAQETEAFNEARRTQIFEVLVHPPHFVYVAGLSGSGKSTSVEKELFQGIDHVFYAGEHQMEDWARDRSKKLKVLFIDEENLSNREWSEFEGLFNIPPGILINGVYHELTPEHRVVFAGNPVSYGDERKLAPFFERHGRAVVFEPLPLAVIYERILKPVFKSKPYEKDSAAISQPLLDVYAFLCSLSTTEVLITPRELQMMALLTASYCDQMPNAEREAVARHYAYELAKELVPVSAKATFLKKFGLQDPLEALPIPIFDKETDFKLTHSRNKAAQCLNELLYLREAKRHPDASTDEQRYGGLGGFILEGEPGQGKSELVMAMLQAHGYKKQKFNAEKTTPESGKIFYHLKLSLSQADKEKLLLEAFDKGAVVVIDEMNSSPMMERLLNDLLMGKRPGEKPGEKTHQPGFMVIGTQNPVTMAGRRAASTALGHRLQTMTLENYSSQEMLFILEEDAPESAKPLLKELVEIYELNSALAEEKHYSPAPTFRDVLRVAKKIKKQYRQSEIILEKPFEKVEPKAQEMLDESSSYLASQLIAAFRSQKTNRFVSLPSIPIPSYTLSFFEREDNREETSEKSHAFFERKENLEEISEKSSFEENLFDYFFKKGNV